jgi:hypothetical protein
VRGAKFWQAVSFFCNPHSCCSGTIFVEFQHDAHAILAASKLHGMIGMVMVMVMVVMMAMAMAMAMCVGWWQRMIVVKIIQDDAQLPLQMMPFLLLNNVSCEGTSFGPQAVQVEYVTEGQVKLLRSSAKLVKPVQPP